MKAQPAQEKIQTWIVKAKDGRILGTTPDENWANAFAGVNGGRADGVEIVLGSLEEAELKLKRQREGESWPQ